MTRINKPWANGVLLGTALLWLTGCGSDEGAGGPGGGFQMPPTPVEIAEVATERVTDRFDAVGSIEAAEAIEVVSEIPGKVVGLPFQEGDLVKRGAVLARLEDAELRASVARANAVLAQRQSAYDRIKLVVEQNAGTPQDLDDAAAELKIAESELALARARLVKARIVAPFSGRVGAREVSPGAFLQPGTRITRLAKLSRIKVVFTAPERYVPKLTRGSEVTITTTAFPGVSLTGTIDVIDPVLDADTRSAGVIARADNPGERFRPGMSANISAVLSERAAALTIPSEAVLTEGDQTLVFMVNPDSSVMKTPVELGLRLRGTVEVLSGLEAGQTVVRAGHQKLFPGARIMPINSRGGSGPSDEGGSPAAGSPPAGDGEPSAAPDPEETSAGSGS